MIRSTTSKIILLAASLLTVLSLVFAMLHGTAGATPTADVTMTDDYVMIGGTKVSRAIGTTEAELNEFIASSIPKTIIFDPETGDYVSVELGNDEVSAAQAQAMMTAAFTEDGTLR